MPHFTPEYNPWDERLCAVPDGDLFAVIRDGKASVVTDHIETLTENGILLKSGKVLEADIIVTATGLQLQSLGGMNLQVDGRQVQVNELMTYEGVLLQGVPNLAYLFGYTNAPWTLKIDMAAGYVCRLMKHMAAQGFGAIRAAGLYAFARQFVAEGYAVYLFDYRNFGDSDGMPRHWVSPRRHLADWTAAIRHVRTLSGIDSERIVRWGTSFSGGHVIEAAVYDHRIRAVGQGQPCNEEMRRICRAWKIGSIMVCSAASGKHVHYYRKRHSETLQPNSLPNHLENALNDENPTGTATSESCRSQFSMYREASSARTALRIGE